MFGREHGAKFSTTLRSGLAQALALLGATGENLRLTGGSTGREFGEAILRELFSHANEDRSYSHWTSLCDVLPLLAEAAPTEFIRALRRGLEGDEPLHRNMFQDADVDEFGLNHPSPHNHFLWALQAIAWSEDYFLDVVELLARLAAIDPGGRWSTRPHTALRDMMSCWHPSSAAHVPLRRSGLRHLMLLDPAVTRRLLIDLIPTGREWQTPAVEPRFRDWAGQILVTSADKVGSVGFIVDMLLDDLSDDVDRHLVLLAKFESLPLAQRQTFAEKLAALGAVITADADRGRLSDAARAKVAHHREYADTQWALAETELLQLERAGQALEPVSAVWRERWLFDTDLVELGDVATRDDYTARDAAVSARRVEAVARLVGAHGIDAVLDLAEAVSYPYLVGYFLAIHTDEFDHNMLASWHKGPHRQEVVRGYLRARLHGNEAAVFDRLLIHTEDPAIKAEVLRAAGDPRTAWERLPGLDEEVTRNYWSGFVHYGLGPNFPGVEQAASGLAEIGRPAATLHLIALYSTRVTTLEVAAIAAQACEALLARKEPDPELALLSEHSIMRILRLLALHQDSLGLPRLARLEWHLFPAWGGDAQAPTLHMALREDPSFFADLVMGSFRANNESAPTEDDSPEAEQRRALAERAYEILNSWTQGPGIGADGLVEFELLRSWVTQAREILQENGRPVTGDLSIGQVLANAPPDPDNLFPPRAVRDLLESVRAEGIERGLEIGIANRRGVTWRGMTDGGAQEWELATSYRANALAASEWPRTKKLLNGLAERYERDARREDDEAERLRRGLSS